MKQSGRELMKNKNAKKIKTYQLFDSATAALHSNGHLCATDDANKMAVRPLNWSMILPLRTSIFHDMIMNRIVLYRMKKYYASLATLLISLNL